MHAPVFWPPPSLKTRRICRNHPQRKGGSSKERGWNFQPLRKQQNAFCNFIFKMKTTLSNDPEHPKIPRPGILSDLCLNFMCNFGLNFVRIFVWFFVWIFVLSFFFSFLNFVWNLSECCLNYCVWIWSEFSIFPLFYRVSIDSDMSEVCWKLSEFCSESCWNFGLNFVWILSDFLSEIVWMSGFCLNYIWVLGPFGGQRNMSMGVWGFERQISAIEASLQWQCRKRPLDKKGVLGFFKNGGCQKIEQPPKTGLA